MAMRSGLFDSKAVVETVDGYPRGDRAEDAQFFAKYFAAFIGNGVYPNPSTNFQVLAYDQMTVRVSAGLCFINGYFGWDTDFYPITLNADTVPRTYRIILRLSLTTRLITIETLRDNISLTRNEALWELALADIKVRANQITITQSDITDLRLNGTLCGVVHGVIDQIDTTTLGNQLNKWIESYKNQTTKDYKAFLEFLENLKSLSTSAYNNLINYFADLKAKSDGNYQILLDHFEFLRNDANKEHQALLLYFSQKRKDTDNQYALLVDYFESLKADGDGQYQTFFQYLDSLRAQGTSEYQKFLIWLEEYKQLSSNEFQGWFDSIKDILDSNAAGNILLRIQDLQSMQPINYIGTITHTLNSYPHCDLYSYEYGFGVGGFGNGPYGGGSLVTIPAKFELFSETKLSINTILEFKNPSSITKLSENMYMFFYKNFQKNLLLIMRCYYANKQN